MLSPIFHFPDKPSHHHLGILPRRVALPVRLVIIGSRILMFAWLVAFIEFFEFIEWIAFTETFPANQLYKLNKPATNLNSPHTISHPASNPFQLISHCGPGYFFQSQKKPPGILSRLKPVSLMISLIRWSLACIYPSVSKRITPSRARSR